MAMFRRNPPPPNGGVECRWCRQKSRSKKLRENIRNHLKGAKMAYDILCFSETIQDMAIVSVEDEQGFLHALLNDVNMNTSSNWVTAQFSTTQDNCARRLYNDVPAELLVTLALSTATALRLCVPLISTRKCRPIDKTILLVRCYLSSHLLLT